VRPDLPAALANLADVELASGAVEPARELLIEALAAQWLLGNRLGQARCLAALATAESLDGDAAEASTLLGAADACYAAPHPMNTPTTVGVAADGVRARLTATGWDDAWRLGHDDPDACIRRMITV
jgi:hypothetical protein